MVDRTIAVVITAYNYGHFLRDCIESVLEQSRPVDEVVVVDDGSTDATQRILEDYSDRLQIIRTENRGQAAAFNCGVAETTADLVLFLDADDLLLTHAVHTILSNWSDEFAHMLFELEAIDEEGLSLGRHPALFRKPPRDNRGDVLQTGSFPCTPTSGNVFARSFLNAAMPMPEKRWRISADCYLVRAAALFGLTGYVPRVLAEYRFHFHNNFARLGGDDKGQKLANLADVADALADLALASEALLHSDTEWLRRKLLHRSNAIRSEIGKSTSKLSPDDSSALRSRSLPIVPLGTQQHLTMDHPASAGLNERLAARGIVALDLRLPQTTRPLSIVVWIETDQSPLEKLYGKGLQPEYMRVYVDGTLATRMKSAENQAVLSIPRAPFDRDRFVRISVETLGGFYPRLTSFLVSDGRETRHFPLIRDYARVPAVSLARGLDEREWLLEPMGSISLAGPKGTLQLSSETEGNYVLTLGLGPVVPAGWLSIDTSDASVFRGHVGVTSEISIPICIPATCEVTLYIDLRLDNEDDIFRIETAALNPTSSSSADAAASIPVSIGESIAFAAHKHTSSILKEGWAIDGSTSPTVVLPEAAIAFLVPIGARELKIELDVSMVLPPAEEERYIIAVSRDGEVLTQANLEGDGTLQVEVGAAPQNGILDLIFHSVIAGPNQESPRPAPITLLSMRLYGRVAPRERQLPVTRSRKPQLRRILDRASKAIRSLEDNSQVTELISCRLELVKLIAESDVALSLLIVGQNERLEEVVALAESTRHFGTTPEEDATLVLLAKSPDQTTSVKIDLIHLLLFPAYRHAFGGNLAQLSVPLLSSPEALASYIGAAPDLPNAKEHKAYRQWLGNLLRSVKDALETSSCTGRLYPLAAASLRQLRSVRTIFAEGNLAELSKLHAGAIERLLLDDGASLAIPRDFRSNLNHLRVGVLVRDVTDTPEGWALRGMYEKLDHNRFEPVLIRVEEAGDPAPEFFKEVLSLSGLQIDEAVRAIRSLDLDVFVTGAYARDYETVSAIYAHRLAPLQIWHTAVCPTTGSFSSFDVALSCRASESTEAHKHYCEPLAWLNGPKQCAYAFERSPPVDREQVRAGLQVKPEQVMLVATAMAHKIGDELIAHWANILKATPSAVLVLAPYAPNWSMDYHRDAFEKRILAAGLPADRVTILPSVPPDRLREVLAASDLMLDSFPYTGATTVCEALSQGTPVVTRAAEALRNLTGASWVRAYGLNQLVASTDLEYVDIATRLAQDPLSLADLRNKVVELANDAWPPHDDREGFGASYSNALWKIAQDSGQFPDLEAKCDAPFVPSRSPVPAKSATRSYAARKLAILASPRTGSTMLCAILNRTPGVICHFELFHETMIQYCNETVTDRAEIEERNADPLGFLERTIRDPRWTGADLVGFKHFAHLNDQVNSAMIDDHEVKLIYLTRENTLAQYSSEMIAHKSGKWAQHNSREDQQPKIQFDRADFEQYWWSQRTQDSKRLARLARAGRNALFIEYIALGTQEMRTKVGDFIGIIIPDEAKPDIKKMNSSDILSRFVNAEEASTFLVERGLEHWAFES